MKSKTPSRDEILAFLRTHREHMVQEYRAHVVGIFGSRARAEERPDSDLDVLVEFLPGATYYDLFDLEDYLSLHVGVRIDVCSVRGLRENLASYIERDLLAV